MSLHLCISTQEDGIECPRQNIRFSFRLGSHNRGETTATMKTLLQKTLLLLVVTSPLCQADSVRPSPVLRVLNWSYYIETDDRAAKELSVVERSRTLQAFQKKFQCKIDYHEYEVEDNMLRNLETMPGYYDVVVMSTYAVRRHVSAGRLEPLSADAIPNRQHILSRYLSLQNDPQGTYFVPYLAGTTGIIYNKAMVGKEVNSWKDYFEPKSHLKGKLHLLNESTIMVPAGMYYLGQRPNTANAQLVKNAARCFYRLKKEQYFGLISADIDLIKSKFLAKELAIGILFSGDALDLVKQDRSKELAYCIPKEGCEFWWDCLTIPSDAPNKSLAKHFVNYMIEPTVHASNAVSLGYICPNKSAMKIIKAQYPTSANNPNVYLPNAILEKLELYVSKQPEEESRLWKKIISE